MYYNKVTDEVKKNFLFQPGSYWIYKITDSSGTYVDSVYEDSIATFIIEDKNNSIANDVVRLYFSIHRNGIYAKTDAYTLQVNTVKVGYKFKNFEDLFYFVVPDSGVKYIKINTYEFYNCYRCAWYNEISLLQNKIGVFYGHSQTPTRSFEMKLLRSNILQ